MLDLHSLSGEASPAATGTGVGIPYFRPVYPVPPMSAPPAAPFSYALDPASRLAYGRMWGAVSGADMLALVRSVHADPAWEAGFDAVWDCSAVTTHIVLPDEVPPIVEDEAASGVGRDVLIESPAAGESALSHMIAAFCRRSGKDMTVHTSLAAGLARLGHSGLPEVLGRQAARQ